MHYDSTLWRAGWLTLAVGLVCLVASFFDARQVNGVNTWIKPLKFALSVGVYLLTLALIAPLVELPEWRRKLFAWGIPALIGGTFALVVVQGARGVPSHFNAATRMDANIFHGMGLLIMSSTILHALLTADTFIRASALPPAFLWGIRLGLLSALIGSLQGMAMIQRMAHTVGAADGGPGLPLLNFSTVAGDLRIAHAVALHGLQILPLAGWWIARQQVPRGSLLVWILFGAIAGLTALAWLQALSGKPLLAHLKSHELRSNDSLTHPLRARRD